jgi:predicted membrane channel-forming protein YqfA (hemolysin III family)
MSTDAQPYNRPHAGPHSSAISWTNKGSDSHPDVCHGRANVRAHSSAFDWPNTTANGVSHCIPIILTNASSISWTNDAYHITTDHSHLT